MKQRISLELITYAALLILGIVLIAYGSPKSQHIVTGIGGALFGAALSGLIGSVTNHSHIKQILELLQSTLNPPLMSNSVKLSKFRRTMFFYHQSDKDGEIVWRYETLEFDKHPTVGFLYEETSVPVPATDFTLRHKVYAYVYGKRFVLFKEALESDEAVTCAVFPDAGEMFRGVNVGLIFKQTWDGTDVIRPCLLSISNLGEGKDGFADDASSEKLTALWKKHIEPKDLRYSIN